MLRGEFHRADGLVIPNNITTYGVKSIFMWALVNTGYSLHMALANCNPDPLLQIEDLGEPTIGTGNYARNPINRGIGGWPVEGEFNGEQYFETEVIVFEATGPGFDLPINRLALVNNVGNVTGEEVVALSGPMPEEITITVDTAEELRSFKYRIYGR